MIWFNIEVMCPKATETQDGMRNSADPDQTALLGAVWSGSSLFAQTHLSKYSEFYPINLTILKAGFSLARMTTNNYMNCM